MIVNKLINDDEINRFSKSDIRWADNKNKEYQTRKVKKGEIYQFEFGKNMKPEMSYEHRGLVIGVNKKLLYVLPIYTYNPKNHKDVFHPVDNNKSKSDLYLLKKSDYPFIQHDSVMKLNDIRSVSINRILYHQKDGIIDINSSEYKTIEKLVLNKYFSSFIYDYENIITNKNQLEEENKKLINQLEELNNVIKDSQMKIDELENHNDNN